MKKAPREGLLQATDQTKLGSGWGWGQRAFEGAATTALSFSRLVSTGFS